MNITELAAILADEKKAFAYIEKMRWPHGPTCPHCGNADKVYALESGRTKPSKKNPKGLERIGRKKCGACRKDFSVRVGTIFEDSPIKLGAWIFAIHMMCSSKKGISANQLSRELKITYKSAWFLCHRVREAMKQEPLAGMLGIGGGIVEADEMIVGGSTTTNKHKNRTAAAGKKTPVLTLIDRTTGNVQTKVIADRKMSTLVPLIRPMVDPSATVMTDSLASYQGLHACFAKHEIVNHNKEYVRGIVHVNFAESFHSLFQRGLVGTFHHVSEKHLPRYLAEFSSRWNSRKMDDTARTEMVIKGTVGKRLMLRQPANPR